MRRRALLAVAATALAGSAGCTSLSDDGGGPAETSATQPPTTETPTAQPTTTKPSTTTTADRPTFDADEVQRRISIESVDSVPDDQPVAIDVELLNGTVTGENPARVRATVTNTADSERRLTDNEGKCALFDRHGGASESPGPHLHRPGFPGLVGDCNDSSRVGNLWRLDIPEDTISCPIQQYGCTPVPYAAGESRPEVYQVWDDYTEPGYMPPGIYRFATTVGYGPIDKTEEFEWGFSIAVERPE
jgi:hypothetical protein